MNLSTRLEELAATQPNKPALIYFDKADWKTVTYKELAELSNRLFLGLQACLLTPGMRAALMTPPSVEFFALSFALIKLGIIPVIVDPAIGLKKVTECLAESKPDIFFGNTLTHTLRIIFGWGKETIRHNLTIKQVRRRTSKIAQLPIYQSTNLPNIHPAAIIFTSGSTGIPKGVLYTHENFSSQLEILRQTFNITPDEIDLPAFPLYALIDVLLGVTSVIPDIAFPVPGKTDPEKVFRAIEKFKVTNMFASPVVLDLLYNWWSRYVPRYRSELLDHRLSSLKRIITAGAPATISLQENFRELLSDHTDLFGIYGATEALPIAKIESREIINKLRVKTESGAGICLGKPVDGINVRIIGITDEPITEWQDSLQVGANVVGEITVQGPAVTRAYIHREDANRLSKIFRHYEEGDLPDEVISELDHEIASGYRPRNDETDVIHRMGDVGYFDAEGRLWYCGRKSHRVVTDDGVMFTEQIENIFNGHPLVNRTALVGVNRNPVLWVELKSEIKNKDTIKRELTEMAKHHSQASKIETFLFMKKFPTDVRHNSKIIREQLTLVAKHKLTNS